MQLVHMSIAALRSCVGQPFSPITVLKARLRVGQRSTLVRLIYVARFDPSTKPPPQVSMLDMMVDVQAVFLMIKFYHL